MQTMTIISGVVLLAVFVLVAWSLRRHNRKTGDDATKKDRPTDA